MLASGSSIQLERVEATPELGLEVENSLPRATNCAPAGKGTKMYHTPVTAIMHTLTTSASLPKHCISSIL